MFSASITAHCTTYFRHFSYLNMPTTIKIWHFMTRRIGDCALSSALFSPTIPLLWRNARQLGWWVSRIVSAKCRCATFVSPTTTTQTTTARHRGQYTIIIALIALHPLGRETRVRRTDGRTDVRTDDQLCTRQDANADRHRYRSTPVERRIRLAACRKQGLNCGKRTGGGQPRRRPEGPNLESGVEFLGEGQHAVSLLPARGSREAL